MATKKKPKDKPSDDIAKQADELDRKVRSHG